MDNQYELVVIGGGGSGMSAAVTAWEAGIKKILILEKRNSPGGNSLIPSPPVKNGVPDHLPPGEVFMELPPEEKAISDYEQMAAWTHCRCNTGIVRALTAHQQAACDWLAEKMGDVDLPDRRQGGTSKILLAWCEKYGIEIATGVQVQALRQKDGRIVGVSGTAAGTPFDIQCNAVVLATGGFLGNQALMKRYFSFCDIDGDLDDMFCYMSFRHEGDGVMLAEQVGAARDSVSIEFGTLRYPTRNGGIAYLANTHYFPQPIWVNSGGKRFVNEGMDQAMNAAISLPGLRSYCLFDQDTFKMMWESGIARSIGGKDLFATLDADFKKDMEAYRDCRICNTIAEAAAFIGCCAEALEETVARYNGFCETGIDSDFGRSPQNLLPIQTAPYYVMRLRLAPLLTHGPVHVNEDMQVVGKQGCAIPGLYCVGADMGGIDVEIYNVKVLGHSMRWAVTSGRIAGAHAAKMIADGKER